MLKSLILAGALAAAMAGGAFAQATQPATPARPAAPPAATSPAPARPAATPQAALIDINSATRAELMTLTGIGEARADAIIRGRPYRGKDDLPRRNIIPQSVYDGIKDKIIARQS
ncbi:ComEA family DNA-binding protein [Phreatobacter sp. AB_2022a]|uniref:ComEA family DNA-binding protein n=1 Tax=Phreatobacter sp. AB_2022a TaxID=3003134 RepID=UPI00056DA139|nr:helix-hairpin-helix domain-containing protein [Phreatobacter sp. AB_2022a]MCZ0734995.1 helix-hairpin-helix domain-containing protein [Phreatobacter sp. AB_2022a]CEJ10670.1 Helix-hairpin-helix motif protein [bacterium YEK0313]